MKREELTEFLSRFVPHAAAPADAQLAELTELADDLPAAAVRALAREL
jgi:hypothetical protein